MPPDKPSWTAGQVFEVARYPSSGACLPGKSETSTSWAACAAADCRSFLTCAREPRAGATLAELRAER